MTAAEKLPTTGLAIPEFQFVLSYGKDALDVPIALVRHVASGKVYDSRDCPELSTDSKMAKELMRAFWFMWNDQGKPEVDFYLDMSDTPHLRKES